MSALVMQGASVHRKPLPSAASPAMVPHHAHADQPHHHQHAQGQGHRHSRTSSSSIFPSFQQPGSLPHHHNLNQHHHHQQQPQPNYASAMSTYTTHTQPTRRTLSNATTSTTSTTSSIAGTGVSSSALRRSSSSRSGASTTTISGTSYVALMRKQKATVWCDRAQHEDPRILAQQRAAKTRAALEVVGGASSQYSGLHAHGNARVAVAAGGGGSLTSGVRSKITHRGAAKASAYVPQPGNLVGAGVPMRLSATEVDEGDSDEEAGGGGYGRYHHRTGSGRSSLGSGRRVGGGGGAAGSYASGGMQYAPPGGGRFSTSSTPPSSSEEEVGKSEEPSPEEEEDDLADETPVPGHYGHHTSVAARQGSYFAQPVRSSGTGLSGGSGSSGGSSEGRENSFGALGEMPSGVSGSAAVAREKSADELRRRGSVDERGMSLSGVRLFVANPDLSD